MAQALKTTTETTSDSTTPRQSRTVSVIIVLAVLLCLAVGVAGYFFYQYRYAGSVGSKADEIASLTKIISAMVELPGGETPTLATVTDKEKLADQPFFQKAENGDKVLIYANSGRAVLYRPSTKKIVDVTTINIKQPTTNDQQPTTESAVAAPAPIPETAPVSQPVGSTVALYNGSAKVGVTNTLEDQIKAAFPDVTVTIKEKAAKSDYQGDLVVDLSGKNADLAKKLADSFSGTVGTLPVGEATPAADILIIVGNKQ